METSTDRTPLMLIHGAWLSSSSWDNFADYFEHRGYDVSAPEWPRKEGDVAQLREAADDLKGLGLNEIVDHYQAAIEELGRAADSHRAFVRRPDRRAIARPRPRPSRRRSQPGSAEGHLGLAVFLAQGGSSRTRASVALARRGPAHPRGVHLRLRRTASPEDAAAAYEKYAVPETGQIFYEAGFANFHLHPPTEVHFKMQDRAPLLIVGAEKDNTVPASLAKKQFEKYEKHEAYDAQTDYVEFAGRPHLMMIAEGWEEIASEIEGWLTGALEASAQPHSASTKA